MRLFARARDLVGTDVVEIDVAESATVGEVRHCLAEVKPALSAMLAACAVAVEMEFARDDRVIEEGQEVAILPPVSGG